MIDGALIVVGLVMLYFGAEWLVEGASRLALSLRVPRLLVGLTVVAYGTSAPEIVVGIQAAVSGHGAVALGNVLGSNIANLGLILGVATLVRPARVDGALRRRELPVLLASTLALPVVLRDGVVAWWEAAALLTGAVAYTLWTVRAARSLVELEEARVRAEAAADAADIAGAPATGTRARSAALAVAGLALLLVGGSVFVQAATRLARAWGMSERVLGLTIVAVGTSLPELATSVVAARRGQSDIAVGNVIGSNIFNVLVCLGAAGVVGRVAVPPAQVATDLIAVVALTLLAMVFVRTERTVRRAEGAALLAAYISYLAYLGTR